MPWPEGLGAARLGMPEHPISPSPLLWEVGGGRRQRDPHAPDAVSLGQRGWHVSAELREGVGTLADSTSGSLGFTKSAELSAAPPADASHTDGPSRGSHPHPLSRPHPHPLAATPTPPLAASPGDTPLHMSLGECSSCPPEALGVSPTRRPGEPSTAGWHVPGPHRLILPIPATWFAMAPSVQTVMVPKRLESMMSFTSLNRHYFCLHQTKICGYATWLTLGPRINNKQ